MDSLRILVAEDLEADVQLLKMAFIRAGVNVPLRFVTNGQKAIDYLRGDGAFANRTDYPMPTMLLLDLKMPILCGFEVLEWLRLQPVLRRLPVVVFTSSGQPEDVNRAFELGANSYLVKPTNFDNLQAVVRHIETYWLKLNLCPECAPASTPTTPPRRILLRNVQTRKYLSGPQKWTDQPGLALNFERTERAMQYALKLKLQQAEIIAAVDAEQYTVQMKIDTDWTA